MGELAIPGGPKRARDWGGFGEFGICGALTPNGFACNNAPGFKTDHVGQGPCVVHEVGFVPKHLHDRVNQIVVSPAVSPDDAMEAALAAQHGVVKHLQESIVQMDPATAPDVQLQIVNTYAREILRLAEISKAAMVAGIMERRSAIDESFAQALTAALRKALRTRLHLTDEEMFLVLAEFEETLTQEQQIRQ